MADMPDDQLLRTIAHEREQAWPDSINIVAVWGKKKRTVEIRREEFFGAGSRGAPMSGDQLIHMVNHLRKMKP